jgi:hypothetical protein
LGWLFLGTNAQALGILEAVDSCNDLSLFNINLKRHCNIPNLDPVVYIYVFLAAVGTELKILVLCYYLARRNLYVYFYLCKTQ